MVKLWRFFGWYTRQYEIDPNNTCPLDQEALYGVFASPEKYVEELVGREQKIQIWVNGYLCNYKRVIQESDFNVLADNQEVVLRIVEQFGPTISGYNPVKKNHWNIKIGR